MKPGRELDALIAREVMDKSSFKHPDNEIGVAPNNLKYCYHCLQHIQPHAVSCVPPNYSTSIEATWKVLEKMKEDGFGFELLNNLGSEWRASFGCHSDVAMAAPHAICLAALKAVVHEV